MAQSNKTKVKNKVKKEVNEQVKKHGKAVVIIAVILILAIIALCVFGYFQGWFDGLLYPDSVKLAKTSATMQTGDKLELLSDASGNVTWSSSDANVATVDEKGVVTAVAAGKATITAKCGKAQASCEVTVNVKSPVVVNDSNLSIHFLELGNNYTGDSVYIKAGDTDVLIDAGSRAGSAATIGAYVDQYCTDGKLEYVIATHAHQDHISGFVGTSTAQGIFERYECENIIDFARTDATSQVYKNYCTKRNAEVQSGANHYTALQCYNNENGAQRVYDLTGNGSITMEILYQKFYENKSGDENNYSVCVLISQGENHYLFTGDLEEKGEESLVESNPNLPEVVLFKGGHHGSYTASNEVLLNKVKPQYVCVCCCAGSVEYLTGKNQNLSHSFPAQEFIDRVAKYTDRVYVTTLGNIQWNESKNKYEDAGYSSMNGNIVFSSVNGEITLSCSNNNTKLKDTEWFKNNRQCPEYWKEGTTTPSIYHD